MEFLNAWAPTLLLVVGATMFVGSVVLLVLTFLLRRSAPNPSDFPRS